MMKKILWLLAAMPLYLAANSNDLDSLKGLILTKAKFPVYNEQNLQSMIYADKAERQGKIIVSSDTVMDLIDNTISVDDIKDGWGTKVYELDAKLPALVDFWGKRPYSRGVIVSRSVNIDQENRSANGKEPIFFRSPVMDLDGIGFESDFDKNTLLVKEDVSIVIRLGASDIKSVIANKKLPAKYEFATATSDSLLIDMKNNTITLINNVVINEEKSVINCDKLTIYLNNTNGLTPKNGSFQGYDLNGVNRIVCDGKVYLKRTGKDRNESRIQATAEKLVYDLESDLITLSGEIKPKITTASGTLSGRVITIDRNNEEIKVLDGAEINSPNLRPPQNSNFSAVSDSQIAQIRQLFAEEDSIVKCSAPANDNKADKPADDKKTDDKKAENGENTSSITSNTSDFNYKGGKLVFEGSVKVRDQQLNLDCDRLEIYLEDKPGEEKKAEAKPKSDDPLAMTEVSSEKKQVKKIVCIGKVRAVDSSMDLMTDKLTLDFDQNAKTSAAAGTLAPGMFQSGNSNVSRATAEGNLIIKSTDDGKKGKKAAANPMGNLLQGGSGGSRTLKADNGFLDFVKNEAEFHGKVNILDDQGNLKCEDMYIYTAKTADKKPKEAKMEDIDADPFAAKKDGEAGKTAPETIVLTDGVELSKIICKNNVEISRKTSKGELQQAFGQQAEYHVGDKRIIMTGTKEKQPWMKVEQGRMFGDRIVVRMETEEMKVDGNTRVELNRGLSF